MILSFYSAGFTPFWRQENWNHFSFCIYFLLEICCASYFVHIKYSEFIFYFIILLIYFSRQEVCLILGIKVILFFMFYPVTVIVILSNSIRISSRPIPCHVIPSYPMSCHPMSCHVMSSHVIPCHIIPSYPMSGHPILSHVMSCHAINRALYRIYVFRWLQTFYCRNFVKSIGTFFSSP